VRKQDLGIDADCSQPVSHAQAKGTMTPMAAIVRFTPTLRTQHARTGLDTASSERDP